MIKLKSRTIYDPILKFGFAIGYGGTQTMMYKKYGYSLQELENTTGIFGVRSVNNKSCLLWSYKWDIETILHEIAHAALYVADHTNTKVSFESEFIPLYSEWLYREFVILKGKK